MSAIRAVAYRRPLPRHALLAIFQFVPSEKPEGLAIERRSAVNVTDDAPRCRPLRSGKSPECGTSICRCPVDELCIGRRSPTGQRPRELGDPLHGRPARPGRNP